MRYAKARLEQERRDFAYRIFITDCIGNIIGLKTRWVEMINPKPVETRSAGEIIDNIRNKLAKIGGENKHGYI